jgi:UDP-N-acetylmuramoyl-tripeptide--D-alanyl-D-alanine ligase
MVFYTWIAKPDYAILGKIDWVHSEFIGGIDKVFKEKSKLIDNLDKDGCAILNIDDKRVGGLAKKVKVDVVTTSTEKKADFKAENIQIDNDFNTRFIVNYDDKKYKFTIPLPGEHLVDSALFSLALGSLVGVGVDDIKKGIENFENEPHRMNPYKIKGNIHIIDDTYNANPTSVKGAINAFLKIAQNRRKILVIGDMRELGAYEKKGHREIGKYIANNEVDILITLGKLAEIIAKSAIISGANKNNVFITQDINKTTALLKNKLKKDDIVLIKGSRSMNMDSIVRQFV